MAMQPGTGELSCSVNERDGLGDDLVLDFVTRVREGAFYGWPWFYIRRQSGSSSCWGGSRPAQPRQRARHSAEAHSASIEMTFYHGGHFPSEYSGDIFAAFHGSWNRSRRTGYKAVRDLPQTASPRANTRISLPAS
jgi:glucose/arabinose dehydrogenase